MLWLVFLLLVGATLAILLYPLYAKSATEPPSRVEFDIVVYRSQLAEIDQEIERGLLTPEQADAARAEVHRRMLAAEDAELANPVTAPRPESRASRTATLVTVSVMVAVGAVALYGALGSPGLQGEPYAWRQKHDASLISAATAEELEQRLRRDPSPAGYKRLAEMYFEARAFDKAAAADRRAVALGATDPDTWSALGEAVTMTNGGAVAPEAFQAFITALDADPKDQRARFYMALAEAQIGNLKQAVAIWRDLEQGADPDAPWLKLVQAHVAALGKAGGFDPAAIAPAPPDVAAMKAAMRGHAAMPGAPTTAPADASATDAGKDPTIRAMVERFAAKMEKNPGDADGWQRLAHFYVVLGDNGKARQAIDHAVRLKPRDAGVLLALAETQKAAAAPAEEAPADVVATMRKVLALEPKSVPALYVVGIAERRAGHADRAKAMWTTALGAAKPDDPLAPQLRAKLNGAP